ncbi:hypothetical protein CQ054_21740 [Ochrobactrum sp. MYb29]|uniref:hypothetical protein n=1 Tax=Brucella pituitosa TaxID=571256 RepID=UPI000C27CFF1|nr:hypothetical protein [Brucella pituitosa]PJO48076.1 hypothetical protein CWE02_10120 [Brucella pituitosa]PRA79177.1 hypothetical protein CQ054_21740 [Ochrobactrum sp. MYb29]
MKNPNRNVVVEYKNRRARKGPASLWGNLDLKSIARQVKADAPQSPLDVQLQSDLTRPVERSTDIKSIKVVSLTEPVVEKVDDAPAGPALSDIDTPEPEEAPTTREEPQTAGITEATVVVEKKPFVRRRLKKLVLQKQEATNWIVAASDIQAELLALEIENADLKRELVARLRAENGQLVKMLRQLEHREINGR